MTSSVGRNSLIMASGTAASRVTGQVRTILLAAAVGTTGLAANAYQAGSMIPQVIFTLVSGGIFNAVLVPQIVRTLKLKDAGDRLNRLITFAIVLLLGITLLMACATPLLTMLYTNGNSDMVALTNAFTLWCMPQIFFYGLYTVIGQILSAKGHFGTYAWSSVFANVISCAGFIAFIALFGKASRQPLAFWSADKLALTAGTWTLGVAVQALALFIPLRRIGLKFHPTWGIKGVGLRSMGSVAAWSLGIVAVTQLVTIVNTRITNNAPTRAGQLFGANQFDVAGNATYQNAYTIYMLPYSLIAVSVATAVFPKISQAIADGNLGAARADLSRSLRNVGMLMCLFTVVFLVMPTPLTICLLPSVSVKEAVLIASPLTALSISLPLASAYLIIQRTFYAFEDGKHPFIFTLLQSGVELLVAVGATLLVSPLHWVTAIGIGITAGYLLLFPLLAWMIRKRFADHLDGRRIGISYAKTLIAAIGSAIAGLVLRGPVYRLVGANLNSSGGSMSWPQAVMTCALLAIVIVAAYCAVLWALRSQEFVSFADTLTTRFKRATNPTSATPADHVSRIRRSVVSTPIEAIPNVRITDTVQTPSTTLRHEVGNLMKAELGDIALGRYTLESTLRDAPGLHVWRASDMLLSRDCQLFIVNDEDTLKQVEAIASFLVLSRNRRFTPMLQLQHRDDITIVISKLDDGMSLSDYLKGPSGDVLSFDAIRTILGETIDAVHELLSGNLTHQSLSTDTIRVATDHVELADTPVSPLLADTSGAPDDFRGGEQRSVRQLAAVLYAMLTRTPSSTDMTFDMHKLGEDVPSEFRVICERGLALAPDGGKRPEPVVSLAELQALLGDWTPLAALSYPDIEKTGLGGNCSIEQAAIIGFEGHHLLELPAGITSKPAAHAVDGTAQATRVYAALGNAGRTVSSAGATGISRVARTASSNQSASSAETSEAAAVAPTAESASLPISFPPISAHEQADQSGMSGQTTAFNPAQRASQSPAEGLKSMLRKLRSAFQSPSQTPDGQARSDATKASGSPEDIGFRDIAAEEVAGILAPSEPGAEDSLFPGFATQSRTTGEIHADEERTTMQFGISEDQADVPGETLPSRRSNSAPFDRSQRRRFADWSDTEPDERSMRSARAPFTLQHLQAAAERQSQSADSPARTAQSRSGSTDGVSAESLPVFPPQSNPNSQGASRQPAATASVSRRGADRVSPAGPARAATPADAPAAGMLPPSFTPSVVPKPASGAADLVEPRTARGIPDDDIADTPLLGRLSTKVVAIVVVAIVVVGALALAVHSLTGSGAIGSTQGQSQWPRLDVNNVPFGQTSSGSPSAQPSSSNGTAGKSSSSNSTIITGDKQAGKVPAPKTSVNNTPYNIDKQEFLTNPAGQRGLAYYMHLSQPQSVYRFQVMIRSSGGKGYLFANTSNDPSKGQQVASFTFSASGTTNVQFSKPITSQDFLMWVPMDSLPGNQLYINSVQLF